MHEEVYQEDVYKIIEIKSGCTQTHIVSLTPASSFTPCFILPTAPAVCSVRMLMGCEWSTLPLSIKCCRVERFRGSYSLRKLYGREGRGGGGGSKRVDSWEGREQWGSGKGRDGVEWEEGSKNGSEWSGWEVEISGMTALHMPYGIIAPDHFECSKELEIAQILNTVFQLTLH